MTQPIQQLQRIAPTVSARVAATVRRRRRLAGLSASGLAERCASAGYPEITRAIIASMESGRRRIVTVDELVAFSRALDSNPETLLYLALSASSCGVCAGQPPAGMTCTECGTEGARFDVSQERGAP